MYTFKNNGFAVVLILLCFLRLRRNKTQNSPPSVFAENMLETSRNHIILKTQNKLLTFLYEVECNILLMTCKINTNVTKKFVHIESKSYKDFLRKKEE